MTSSRRVEKPSCILGSGEQSQLLERRYRGRRYSLISIERHSLEAMDLVNRNFGQIHEELQKLFVLVRRGRADVLEKQSQPSIVRSVLLESDIVSRRVGRSRRSRACVLPSAAGVEPRTTPRSARFVRAPSCERIGRRKQLPEGIQRRRRAART